MEDQKSETVGINFSQFEPKHAEQTCSGFNLYDSLSNQSAALQQLFVSDLEGNGSVTAIGPVAHPVSFLTNDQQHQTSCDRG